MLGNYVKVNYKWRVNAHKIHGRKKSQTIWAGIHVNDTWKVDKAYGKNMQNWHFKRLIQTNVCHRSKSGVKDLVAAFVGLETDFFFASYRHGKIYAENCGIYPRRRDGMFRFQAAIIFSINFTRFALEARR